MRMVVVARESTHDSSFWLVDDRVLVCQRLFLHRWKLFIVVSEFAVLFAYYGILSVMIMFWKKSMVDAFYVQSTITSLRRA
jgi:hypothetical protein